MLYDKYVLIVPRKFDCNRTIIVSLLLCILVISDNIFSSENTYIHTKNHFSYRIKKTRMCRKYTIEMELLLYIEDLINWSILTTGFSIDNNSK